MEQETARLKRVNELAEKAKTSTLTPEEIEERTILRKEYLAAFRANMTSQMENIYIKDVDGTEKKLERKAPSKKHN